MINVLQSFVLILGLFGIPSIFTMTIWCIKTCKTFVEQIKILQEAQKAQMRSQLLHQYYIYREQDKVAADDIDDWLNQYKAYHKLVGDNEVLDTRKEEIKHMPTYERK